VAVGLVRARQVEEAKWVLKVALEHDPQLRAVIFDHPGPEEVSD